MRGHYQRCIPHEHVHQRFDLRTHGIHWVLDCLNNFLIDVFTSPLMYDSARFNSVACASTKLAVAYSLQRLRMSYMSFTAFSRANSVYFGQSSIDVAAITIQPIQNANSKATPIRHLPSLNFINFGLASLLPQLQCTRKTQSL